MSESNQTNIVFYTMRALKSQGSWCGETHVQKSLFLCQEITRVASGFKYILYKHGPYSFELSDHLQLLMADDFVHIMSKPPYGPSLELSAEAIELAKKVDELGDLGDRISFIAKKLNKRGVSDLEKLATAVHINNKYPSDFSVDKKADLLHSIKGHVSVEAAKQAFAEVDRITEEAAVIFN